MRWNPWICTAARARAVCRRFKRTISLVAHTTLSPTLAFDAGIVALLAQAAWQASAGPSFAESPPTAGSRVWMMVGPVGDPGLNCLLRLLRTRTFSASSASVSVSLLFTLLYQLFPIILNCLGTCQSFRATYTSSNLSRSLRHHFCPSLLPHAAHTRITQ